MPDIHPDTNPFQPPLRLPSEGDRRGWRIWRLVGAGTAGLLSGGIAGDLLSNAVFQLARVALHAFRPPLVVVAICCAFGTLVGAASGAVAGVRLTMAPRLRPWLVGLAACLGSAGFGALYLMQQTGGASLLRIVVLGGFSGFVAGAILCALLPRRHDADDGASSPSYSQTTKRVGISLAVTVIVLAALFFQGLENSKNFSQGHLGVAFDESAAPPSVGGRGGVVVTGVARGSTAEAAGIRAGDHIVGVDNRRVETGADLRAILLDCGAGETVMIDLMRDDKQVVVNVELMDVFAMEQTRFDAFHQP